MLYLILQFQNLAKKPLKNKLIEVNTTLKFQDKKQVEKKSYFELVYSSIVKIGDNIKEKKDLQKIILCDVKNDISTKRQKWGSVFKFVCFRLKVT